ncbi:MAG: hypothetical protein M3R15_05140 [Acidobacteriota bacterium]|nr:hypothetical protein [Acidobacteriota bacterium]
MSVTTRLRWRESAGRQAEVRAVLARLIRAPSKQLFSFTSTSITFARGWLLVKADASRPVWFAPVLALLLGYRLIAAYQKSKVPISIKSPTA